MINTFDVINSDWPLLVSLVVFAIRINFLSKKYGNVLSNSQIIMKTSYGVQLIDKFLLTAQYFNEIKFSNESNHYNTINSDFQIKKVDRIEISIVLHFKAISLFMMQYNFRLWICDCIAIVIANKLWCFYVKKLQYYIQLLLVWFKVIGGNK